MSIVRRFLCLVCVCCLLCGCGAAEKAPQKFSASFYGAFDTVITLIGYADSQQTFDGVLGEVREQFLYYHRIFDGYKEYEGIHNLYYVNRNAAREAVPAEPELIDLLLYMKQLQPGLRGRVNVALGAVLGYWHDCREEGERLPEASVLQKLGNHVSMEDLVIDPEKETVYFADPYLKLDLGAVAKGYVTEIVAQWLLGSAMPSFVLSAGGNVRCGLEPLDERCRWGVGIQDPDSNDRTDIVFVTGLSVVTSGDYQRYYTVDGVRYHHLIDPDTLYPARYMRSVTVVTQDSGLADVLSTALFLMPYEEGLSYVDELDGVDAFWILNDNSVRYSQGARRWLYSCGVSALDPMP